MVPKIFLQDQNNELMRNEILTINKKNVNIRNDHVWEQQTHMTTFLPILSTG